jgi:hypothetical protein
VPAHALHIAGTRPRDPAPGLELSRPGPRWGHGRGRGRQADPPLRIVDVAQLEQRHRHAAGGEELDGPVALELCRSMGILAA